MNLATKRFKRRMLGAAALSFSAVLLAGCASYGSYYGSQGTYYGKSYYSSGSPYYGGYYRSGYGYRYPSYGFFSFYNFSRYVHPPYRYVHHHHHHGGGHDRGRFTPTRPRDRDEEAVDEVRRITRGGTVPRDVSRHDHRRGLPIKSESAPARDHDSARRALSNRHRNTPSTSGRPSSPPTRSTRSRGGSRSGGIASPLKGDTDDR